MERQFLFQVYPRQPLVLVRGRGPYVWDDRGRKYLDFFSGLAVCSLGHTPARVTRAIFRQAKQLWHTSNLYYTIPQIRLAQALIAKTFPGRVFFSNSGAEANECALKLVRRWGQPATGDWKGGSTQTRSEVITFHRSFHGRTLGTLSATGQIKFQRGFHPLLPGFRYARLNDVASVEQVMTPQTCAILVEPIQGEGGVVPATPEFLQALRRLADRHRLLLIFDEIQTGVGRTGTFYAFQQLGVKPDIVTLAKGLGGGLPIGATVATPAVADLFGIGDHASTFGGNPVVCAGALEVLRTLTPAFLARVRKMGQRLLTELQKLPAEFPVIREIRGRGLMLGLELTIEGTPLVDACRARGLLINCVQERVLRLLPPLTIGEPEIRAAVQILRDAFAIMGP
ncbi:MAG: aspartate aminotransferase family protein [Elusimicrobia bacterium]|nr:aspartate aminotransferase family protein [Elusimicrobiota bacterium]